MKKLFYALLTLSASSSVIAGATLGKNAFYEMKAYTTSNLPTTIDLNDCTETVIRNYYSSLNGLSDDEKQGANLLRNLKPILKNNQKYYGYDGSTMGKKIWQMYEIIDRDWEKSPASEIEGYDAASNTITGYSYGSSATKPGDNPYIHALYVDRNVDNNVRAWAKTGTTSSSHGNNAEWCIDREHIWPKSHGFEDEGQGGARGDPMHLWAGDSYVNSALHSNYYYGFVDKGQAYTDGKDKYAYAANNLMGKSLTLGGTKSVFEPQDSDKGDIARAVFYMVARYNYLSGEDADGIDNNNPNLEIVFTLDTWVESGYLSTETKTGKMGILADLLEWHHMDPVDEFEIHRNNLLFNNFTNNRNPFIDFPEWIDYIWGTVTYQDRNLVSYNDTPTGHANPLTDKISTFNGGGTEPGSGDTSEPTTSSETTTSATTSEPGGNGESKPLDTKTIIIIAVAVGVGLLVLVIIILVVSRMSKKNKKKVLKTAKKVVKSSSKKKK